VSEAPILYAFVILLIGLGCGLLPLFTKIKDNEQRLKMLTGIASGVIIASALLVVIPEGLALASDDPRAEDAAVAGEVALVLLEVNDGDLNATEAMEAIESLAGGHDHAGEDEHDDEAHDAGDEPLSTQLLHVVEEVEAGDINATAGLDEVAALLAGFGHEEEDSHGEHGMTLLMGGAIMGGFLLMLALEGSGIGHAVHEEHHDHDHHHGHQHVHHGEAGWMLVFGLTLHAATDGLAIGAAAATGNVALTVAVVFAVLIHKGPAAISLGIFSMHERAERNDTVRDVVVFSLATPVMMLASFFVLDGLATSSIGLAMLFSAGTFLYVATVDTLPDIHSSESGMRSMINVVIGALGLALLLFAGDALGLMEHGH